MFRTLKDYKAAFLVGARLLVIDHWRKELVGQVRVVDKPQGKQYRYHIESDPEQRPCWGDHPHNRDSVVFNDDGSFTVRYDIPKSPTNDGGLKFWTMRFL